MANDDGKQLGGKRLGPFLVDSRLAVGGTSEVFLVRRHGATPSPTLVLKRPLSWLQSDENFRDMFAREAQLQALVRHRNVVEVFETGLLPGGEPFLTLEFIDGIDGYRLLRRLRQEDRKLASGVAVHLVAELLEALSAVHAACDPAGNPLGIIHRDVSPSNLYIGEDGRVKLGDFGLASTMHRASRPDSGATLKGKFAYVAPEQVEGIPFDHRADLFSAAIVLAEALLGQQLFRGAGQLAVLLAIRDCDLAPLDALEGVVPGGLLGALRNALAKDPNHRFQDAATFRAAILPFAAPPPQAARALRAEVLRIRGNPTRAMERVSPATVVGASFESLTAGVAPAAPKGAPVAEVLPGGFGVPNALAPAANQARPPELPEMREPATTTSYGTAANFFRSPDGTTHGPLSFAELIEALIVGRIEATDPVSYQGAPFVPCGTIDELLRFLPSATATTTALNGPDLAAGRTLLTPLTLLSHLADGWRTRGDAALICERPLRGDVRDSTRVDRKEIYLREGFLYQVASNEPSELLGEFLLRRGQLDGPGLALAKGHLSRYEGRMGDTLIALGLVDPMTIFQAIRAQGRSRLADLFAWPEGSLLVVPGGAKVRPEFPLKLDILTALVEATSTVTFPVPTGPFRAVAGSREAGAVHQGPESRPTPSTRSGAPAALPPLLERVLDGLPLDGSTAYDDVLRHLARGGYSELDARRALHILIAAGLATRV